MAENVVHVDFGRSSNEPLSGDRSIDFGQVPTELCICPNSEDIKPCIQLAIKIAQQASNSGAELEDLSDISDWAIELCTQEIQNARAAGDEEACGIRYIRRTEALASARHNDGDHHA